MDQCTEQGRTAILPMNIFTKILKKRIMHMFMQMPKNKKGDRYSDAKPIYSLENHVTWTISK